MYYPKNKILENQYTAGKQYIYKSSGKEYIGYYYILSDGRIFNGKNPQYYPTEELIKFKDFSLDSITDPMVLSYNKLKKGTSIEKILTYGIIPTFYPNPTNEEYTLGIITRYFCKPINGNSSNIKEISKDTYESLLYKKGEYDSEFHIITKLPWQISGPLFNVYQGSIVIISGIINTNFNQIKLVERNFPGLSNYLRDLKEFSK